MNDSNFSWPGKKVLVTGGAGLIGSHLVDALVARGAKVKVLDSLDVQTHPHGKPSWINARAEFIHGDMRNKNDLTRALTDVEYVYHQAAFGGFTPELSQYIDANALGTALMFELIRENKFPIKKIVAASSQAVYGEGTYQKENEKYFPKQLRSMNQLLEGRWEIEAKPGEPLPPLPTNEEKPLYTETIYGISKLAQEKLTIGMGRMLGIPTVALRYAVTFGPRQSIFNPYTGVVSIFSTQLLNNVAPTVYEDGQQSRDYIYVEDNVAANILVMEKPEANYEVFNVGSGQAVTVNKLVTTLAKLYGKNIDPSYPAEFRPGDVRHFIHDCSKISKLGFKTKSSLEEGLGNYVKWILSQGNVGEYFTKAREKMASSGVVFKRNK